jgi:hypothetical protein
LQENQGKRHTRKEANGSTIGSTESYIAINVNSRWKKKIYLPIKGKEAGAIDRCPHLCSLPRRKTMVYKTVATTIYQIQFATELTFIYITHVKFNDRFINLF